MELFASAVCDVISALGVWYGLSLVIQNQLRNDDQATNDHANPVAARKLPIQKPVIGNSGSAFWYARLISIVVLLTGYESDLPRRLAGTMDRYRRVSHRCHSVSRCQLVHQDFAYVASI